MPQPVIHLSLPCSENWETMRSDGTGRHCAACQDTVVDFTQMTDGEVAAFLAHYPHISCGRFRASQLKRPLAAAAQPLASWQRWLGTTLALLGIGALVGPKAQGQAAPQAYWGGPVATNSASPAAETTKLPISQPNSTSLSSSAAEIVDDSTVLVQGTVHTKWGARKMDARVSLNYAHGTTDKQGHFEIRVPKSKLESIHYIRVYYRDPQHDDHLLFAKVPFDPERRLYHVTLKEPEPIISGKFR